MNTTTLIGTIATVLRAVGLTAWVVTQGPTTSAQTPVIAERTAVVAPAVPAERAAVAAPAAPVAPQAAALEIAPQSAALEVEQPAPDARPAKCGDLPRAPWNTCVALHDHEI